MDAIMPEYVDKIVLAASVAVLAISNAVVYRKYRRAVAACGRAGGKRQEKAERWTTAVSEEGPKAGSDTDSGARAEGTVGSSGTFADLCEDGQDADSAKGAADTRA